MIYKQTKILSNQYRPSSIQPSSQNHRPCRPTSNSSSKLRHLWLNAGIEFDIDALERQLQAQQTQSIASNLIANNININTNKTTTIVGSNLQANANNAVNSDNAVNSNNANNAVNTDNTNNGQININSQNLNILSSQDTNNTKSNTQHKNLNVSYTLYGTNSSNLRAASPEIPAPAPANKPPTTTPT
ncbi:hypothetical protein BSPWISOXPB_349 [uncultured Gammaproteobacteria bacterium]|nr:hypothetical protein BSPWISOXPB_349 [uncultured Gammaproteobacteria bacterium]